MPVSYTHLIDCGGVKIGGKEKIAVMAGPCSIEGAEQALRIAQGVKAGGATPVSYPHLQTALQDALAAYGEDRNGDGKVVVKLNLYTMDFGNEDSDAYLDMAGTTKLSTDIQGALSSIFILYDPARCV